MVTVPEANKAYQRCSPQIFGQALTMINLNEHNLTTFTVFVNLDVSNMSICIPQLDIQTSYFVDFIHLESKRSHVFSTSKVLDEHLQEP